MTTTRAIRTPAIEASATVEEALRLAKESDCSWIAVVRDGAVLGFLTQVAMREAEGLLTIGDVVHDADGHVFWVEDGCRS